MTSTAAYAKAYVERYKIALLRLEPRKKFPSHEGWNQPGGWFENPESAFLFYEAHPTWGMGALLGQSGLCSLDIDQMQDATRVLTEYGIDVGELAAASPCIMGRPQHLRFMFRVPEGEDLSRHILRWPDNDNPSRFHTVLELRGGDAQDVLPPSIHPDTGQPYEWVTKPSNGEFPVLPETLLAMWKHWDVFHPQAADLCPWAVVKSKPLPDKPRNAAHFEEGDSIIAQYIAAHPVEEALAKYGYEARGPRWLSPHSSTKLPGVTRLDDTRVFIHHASDPLCTDPPHPINSFDLFCHYEHNDNLRNAVKEAAVQLGVPGAPKLRKQKPECPVAEKTVVLAAAVKSEASLAVEAEAQRVAKLDSAEYDMVRHSAAKAAGIRVTTLDAMRADVLAQVAADAAPTKETRVSPLFDTWMKLGLDMSPNGPMCNLRNAAICIKKGDGLTGLIWYDEFYHRIRTRWEGPLREWTDIDTLKMTMHLQQDFGLRQLRTLTTWEAVMLVAREDVRNEPKDWMAGLEWDHEPRLEFMLSRGFGMKYSTYSEAVGRCWMTSMVARIFEPGCKVDTVPVFEGEQGLLKGTALKVIGGDWFAECHDQVLSRDFYMTLEGKMLVEVSEMHSFAVNEQRRVKGMISCQVDRYREPYGRIVMDHPRQAVLAGTTNEFTWNRDPTGARRFWPVRVEKIDIPWLTEHRDQLFAEAVFHYQDAHIWHNVPGTLAQGEQDTRYLPDAWEGEVTMYIQGRHTVYVGKLLNHLDIPMAQRSPAIMGRMCTMLRILGFQPGRDADLIRCWKRESED